MESIVYYFSGTGNSLFVARELAERLKASLIPVASRLNKEEVPPAADSIGIVFPVYYNRIPVIIESFVDKLLNIDNTFLYIVCTYGGGPGESGQMIQDILDKKGKTLSASFGVHMPQNAFNKPWEKNERIYKKAVSRIDAISKRVLSGRNGSFFSDRLLHAALAPISGIFENMTIKALSEISGSAVTTDFNTLIYLADTGMSANDQCNGCGICAKVCPVGNIEIVDKRPQWLHRCENCLACYNWCPNNAIKTKIVAKEYHYRHPYIKINEIMAQKQG